MAKAPKAPEATAEIGHNKPAILTKDMLVRDFAHLETAKDEVEALFKACPPVAEDDEDIETLRATARRGMAEIKRIETARVSNKEPYLSAQRVNDAHFNSMREIIQGWMNVIEARAKRLLDKRAADERARREQEAREAAQAAAAAALAAREAEQRRIEMEQAKLLEALSPAPPQAEEDTGGFSMLDTFASAPVVAPVIDVVAARRDESIKTTEAIMASNAAMKASEAAAAKPADMVRVRSGDGITTLAETWDFEIMDAGAVDLNALREHFSIADIEKAIRRFVSLNKGDRSLQGVRIFSGTKIRMT